MSEHANYVQRRMESAAIRALASAEQGGLEKARKRSWEEMFAALLQSKWGAEAKGLVEQMRGQIAHLQEVHHLHLPDISNQAIKPKIRAAMGKAKDNAAVLKILHELELSMERFTHLKRASNLTDARGKRQAKLQRARDGEATDTRTVAEMDAARDAVKGLADASAARWQSQADHSYLRTISEVNTFGRASTSTARASTSTAQEDEGDEGRQQVSGPEADEAATLDAAVAEAIAEEQESEDDDEEQGQSSDWRQSDVVTDHAGNPEDETLDTVLAGTTAQDDTVLSPTAAARVGQMRFFENLAKGDERLNAVLDLVMVFCPFCAPEAGLVPEGLAKTLPPCSHAVASLPRATGTVADYVEDRRASALTHLRRQHPNIFTALRAGKRLERGIFVSALLPQPFPLHPIFAGHEHRLFAPLPARALDNEASRRLASTFFGFKSQTTAAGPSEQSSYIEALRALTYNVRLGHPPGAVPHDAYRVRMRRYLSHDTARRTSTRTGATLQPATTVDTIVDHVSIFPPAIARTGFVKPALGSVERVQKGMQAEQWISRR
ncbi:unnamed protein product [Parajaminaea phylloscopi]